MLQCDLNVFQWDTSRIDTRYSKAICGFRDNISSNETCGGVAGGNCINNHGCCYKFLPSPGSSSGSYSCVLLELSVDAVLGDVLCVSFLSFFGDSTVFGELSVSVLVSRDRLEFKFISISVGG